MNLFNCKVRLANSKDNEVRKEGVTAAEIHVLRALHAPSSGEDPILDVVLAGKTKRTDSEERLRLEDHYGESLKTTEAKGIRGLFGVGVPLPDMIEGAVKGAVDPAEPIRRGPVQSLPE